MAKCKLLRVALFFAACVLGLPPALAARVSDVRNTLHNLSASGAGTVKAVSESQICAFCHTPHAATPNAIPLWNRKLSMATYTPYTSSSLDANVIQGSLDQPGGSSKLCLSCHDGTLAIGNVNVLNGQGSAAVQGTQSITMSGTGAGGFMPDGSGATTGFTRNLGIDLTNDHPISVTYTAALAARDGELRPVDGNQKWPPGTGTVIGVRTTGYRPPVPLEPTGAGNAGQVQCATCHDPHIRETVTTEGNQKFLRLNRFQTAAPGPTFNASVDVICLSCHDKNGVMGVWAYSAHANPLVATQTYLGTEGNPATPAGLRQFPTGIPVWKASCLNCHDTHTVQGARRLLREGTDGVGTPKTGGSAALEETCYQCHTNAASSILSSVTTVSNIRDDFVLSLRRMPITSANQAAGTEMHDIGGAFNDAGLVDCTGPANRCGADFIESRARLGRNNPNNRHAECTDCHNPHRVVKFKSFLGNPAGSLSGAPDASGTHTHTDTIGYTHTNIASGVLRGTSGVEPTYGSTTFDSLPASYVVKRGDPGASVDTSVGAGHVTREYQICLKCHSDYGYSDNNTYPTGDRPNLGSFTGGTPSGTNNLTQYTNQAKEFQSPLSHRSGVTAAGTGAAAAYATNNHRSWHPVMDVTGRTGAIRGNGTNISARWRLPWSNSVGAQSMYCSDCHGSNVTSATSVIPDGAEDGKPWGPHGSNNNFLLKGLWNTSTGSGQQATGLCFKCHDYASYATDSGNRTGFYNDPSDRGRGDLHSYHANRIGSMRCNWCHVAVPHGWKNKALLVNLNDVGPEGGFAAGTQQRNVTTAGYNREPYYLNSVLKVINFRNSGLWRENDCGSAGAPGNGLTGKDWMTGGSESCSTPP